MFKQEKGITLVALVITIIVLLILAGVSLSMVMGDGSVLGQARTAVDSTEKSSVTDEVNLALSAAQANYYAQYANGDRAVSLNGCLSEVCSSKNADGTFKEFPAASDITYAGLSSGTTGDVTITYKLPNNNQYEIKAAITEGSITLKTVELK